MKERNCYNQSGGKLVFCVIVYLLYTVRFDPILTFTYKVPPVVMPIEILSITQMIINHCRHRQLSFTHVAYMPENVV